MDRNEKGLALRPPSGWRIAGGLFATETARVAGLRGWRYRSHSSQSRVRSVLILKIEVSKSAGATRRNVVNSTPMARTIKVTSTNSAAKSSCSAIASYEKRLHQVAVHEAAHFCFAVVFDLLGSKRSLSIIPSDDGSLGRLQQGGHIAALVSSGAIAFGPGTPSPVLRNIRLGLRRQLLIIVAGAAAENALCRRRAYVYGSDFATALRLAEIICGEQRRANSGALLSRYFKRAESLCRRTLKNPILMVAQRLEARKEMDRAALDALAHELGLKPLWERNQERRGRWHRCLRPRVCVP